MIATGSGHKLSSLLFEDNKIYRGQTISDICPKSCSFGSLITDAVAEYYRSGAWNSSIALHSLGTPFQQHVWRALAAVPAGETRSYQEIARAIGRPTAARAVAGACRRNPYTLIIPCHRVVGSTAALTGYAGGLWRKEWLLQFERKSVRARSL